MQEFTIINIDWKSENDLPEKVANSKIKNVIYQAYGDSPIYGKSALLYIGKCEGEIKKRHKEHINSDFDRIANLNYLIGEVRCDSDVLNILYIVEGILITMLKPSYNSFNIKDTLQGAKERKFLILNRGNRGIIPLETSNIWWP